MASKTISLEEPLVAALQRFAAAQGCSWVIMRFSNDALQLSVENNGDFHGFRCAMQALDNGSGTCAPAFAVLKVQLSEAKGGLQVDSLGRQKRYSLRMCPQQRPFSSARARARRKTL